MLHFFSWARWKTALSSIAEATYCPTHYSCCCVGRKPRKNQGFSSGVLFALGTAVVSPVLGSIVWTHSCGRLLWAVTSLWPWRAISFPSCWSIHWRPSSSLPYPSYNGKHTYLKCCHSLFATYLLIFLFNCTRITKTYTPFNWILAYSRSWSYSRYTLLWLSHFSPSFLPLLDSSCSSQSHSHFPSSWGAASRC